MTVQAWPAPRKKSGLARLHTYPMTALNHFNTQPVFILGAHKSGSSLLRSLLDGHPELFVIPIETHFFQLSNYWVDYRLRRALPPQRSVQEAKKAFTGMVERYNTTGDTMSDSDMVGRFDLAYFQRELEAYEPASQGELLAGYVRAIYAGIHQAALPQELRVVEKSVENAEFAPELKRIFPGSRFIHVIRCPYANLVSLRRHTGRTGYPFLMPALSSLYNNTYHLQRNQRLLGDYLVLKYEDLLQEPARYMKQVSEFLEIDYTDNLLQPTVCGCPWGGNSSRGITYEGIEPGNIDRWQSEINHLEIAYTNRYFKHLLEAYAYPVLQSTRSHWSPIRGESLKVYLLNRLIPFYL